MTWQQLQNANRVRPHRTSKRELDDLRTVIERDLHDAGIAGLSADRSFEVWIAANHASFVP